MGGVGSIDIEAGIGGQLLEPPGDLVLFDCWKNVLIIEPQTSQNEQGEGVSTLVIKERLRNLVSSEEAGHPLSDLQLTEQLRQQGLNVARRTVAKYREELGLPSSSLRRRY